jgi:hypothetical protein
MFYIVASSFKITLFMHTNLICSLFFVENCIILISSILSSVFSYQMARSRQTARKSTGGRFPYGQLAPRHPPAEVVEQQEVEDYPVQVHPEMIVEEH